MWVFLAVIFFLLSFSTHWMRYFEFYQRGIETKGQINKLEPDNHQIIRYSYIVSNHTYFGTGNSDFGNPPFPKLNVGDSLIIYYLPFKPEDSISGYPKMILMNESLTIASTTLIIPTFMVFGFSIMWGRRGDIDNNKINDEDK